MTLIPTTGGQLCPHFGHCEQFAVIETDAQKGEILGTSLLTPPPHEPGLLPRWLHEQGANVVIAGGMGRRAQQLFEQGGVTVVVGAVAGTPEQLAAAYLSGTLRAGENLCDH